MSNDLVGKPSPSRLRKLLEGNLGAHSRSVLVGPGPGLDAAVIEIGGGRVMVIAEDPIFPAPGLPLEIMGEFTVHIGASDVAVTGVRPTAMTYTLLLPPGCPESDAGLIIRSISQTANALGITIAGGHTGWYGAVTIPTVGGVSVWGFAEAGKWISPGGAREGDALLMTKGPAIEASALLGVLYRDKLVRRLAAKTLDAICARTAEITVVKDALAAFEGGITLTSAPGSPRANRSAQEGASSALAPAGAEPTPAASRARRVNELRPGENPVHAMHDATEGGVLGGIWEMAEASGLSVLADLDAAPVPDDIASLADALGFDPWRAISEGTLLAAVAPAGVDAILSAWAEAGILGHRLGAFGPRERESTISRGGRTEPLREPGIDPFWPLFFAGLPPGAP
jgi:hydrogenase expression/formation protein HypE